MSRPAILAIDGGGSKTLVAIADHTGVLRRIASGAGINPMDSASWRTDFEAIVAPVRDGLGDIGAAVAALPSYGEVAAISAAQERSVAMAFDAVPHRVVNDVDAAHFGAFAGGPGVLILAGTGSMAWASDGEGRSIRVGGWGDAFGDEGSAHWIGLRAITLASRAIDSRLDAPALLEAIFGALSLDRAKPQDSLLRWHGALRHPRSEIAALAPVVDDLATAGDPTAASIIEAAAGHLALHVSAAARLIGAGREPIWSYAGGAFASRRLLDALVRKVGAPPRRPILPPIGGALLHAARDLDWPVDEAWIGRLAASIENNAVHARNGRNPPPEREPR